MLDQVGAGPTYSLVTLEAECGKGSPESAGNDGTRGRSRVAAQSHSRAIDGGREAGGVLGKLAVTRQKKPHRICGAYLAATPFPISFSEP